MSEAAKRILIVRLSAIGDVLRVLPAFQVLKKNYPDSYVSWVVEEKAKDILEAHPDIDEVFVFPKEAILKKLKSLKNIPGALNDFFSFTKTIKNKNFDLVIDFHGLFKSGIISFLSGAPERAGFSKAFSRELNFLFNNRRFSIPAGKMSRIDRNLALLKEMGLDIQHKPQAIHIPEKHINDIRIFFKQNQIDMRRPVVAIHPGTSPDTPYKRWDSYRYAVVADRIIEDKASQVIFTWAKSEIETVREITGLMKHKAIIGPETESLCSLAEIFRNCSLFLGNDTGPMHLAAFMGIPVVAIFGPTDHIVNEPCAYTPHIIIRKETTCSPSKKKIASERIA
jgi:heptosyltransferase I